MRLPLLERLLLFFPAQVALGQVAAMKSEGAGIAVAPWRSAPTNRLMVPDSDLGVESLHSA